MRYLLLFLLLALQSSIFGYSANNQHKNAAQKTLVSVKSDLNARSHVDFKYQGQYEDSETGLCYNRFRYYSPESGTYVSQDPIKFAGGGNFYAYVLDSNSWVDAFGLSGDLTVVRLDGNAGGNHYALLYDKGGSQQITDLIGADG